MGIHGLTKFVREKAPECVKFVNGASLLGQWVAVDASLSLYQFMVAIRDAEDYGNLQNAAGEVTSHITGMLSRVTRILELGIKPVYVFDGKAPMLKSGELAKRKARKAVAEAGLAEAKELGDAAEIKKFAGRIVRVTKEHNNDIRRLLKLMGIPVLDAASEAEAQCAALAKEGFVHGVATEDADALCFGTPILIRRLAFSDSSSRGGAAGSNDGASGDLMIIELPKLLSALSLTQAAFIDFCILCGCDYCDTIKGIGPASALKLIQKHGNLETIIANLDAAKYPLPENFDYQSARSFFLDPEINRDFLTQDKHINAPITPAPSPSEVAPSAEPVAPSAEPVIPSAEPGPSKDGSEAAADSATDATADTAKDTKMETLIDAVVEATHASHESKPTTAGGQSAPAQQADPQSAGRPSPAFKSIESKQADTQGADAGTSQNPGVRRNVKNFFTLFPMDEEGLQKFLIDENQFNPDRVARSIARLKKARGKSEQSRLDSFFFRKPAPTAQAAPSSQPSQTAQASAGGKPVEKSQLSAGAVTDTKKRLSEQRAPRGKKVKNR